MKNKVSIILLSLLMSSMNAFAESMISESPSNAEVYFIQPTDGERVQKNVKVVFGLKNMGIAPAGIDRKNTGHHHLLIDTESLPDMTKPLPASDKVKHFGGGQTETVIELSPGQHTLQLLLGNHLHIPHSSPVVSEKITITVE